MDYIVNLICNILTSSLPCCLLALGIFLTYRLLDFADLTAEGSFLIGGATCLSLIYNGVNPFLATLIGMLGGMCCGIITGILNTELKIPKLLSGIITMTGVTSLTFLIIGTTNKQSKFANLVSLRMTDKTIYSTFYSLFDNKANLYVEIVVMLIFVIITLTLIYYFFGTEFGMSLRATGMNAQMARAQGINTKFATVVCVALSNALIGLSGALFAQDYRSMDIKTSSGFLVIGLASILIGESIFGKRNFKNWIISVSLGAIVYFIIVNVAIALGFPTQLKNFLYAFLITIALCLPLIKEKLKKVFEKKSKEEVHNA